MDWTEKKTELRRRRKGEKESRSFVPMPPSSSLEHENRSRALPKILGSLLQLEVGNSANSKQRNK